MRLNYIYSLLLLFTVLGVRGQDGKLPIIDMHLHSSTEIWSKASPCYPPGDCEGIKTTVTDPKELLNSTITQMD